MNNQTEASFFTWVFKDDDGVWVLAVMTRVRI
jgi:hypothetical protein